MEYSLQVQIDQLNQRIDELSNLVEQFSMDILAYHDTDSSSSCFDSDESLELPAMFRYLAKRIEECGFMRVRYYMYLENFSSIHQRHKVLFFRILRSICLKALRHIYASKIVIELTEESFGFLLEIAYHQVDPVVFVQADDSLACVEALIEHQSGEMSIGKSGDVLSVHIALPI